MNEISRLFDFLYEQQANFPKKDMLAGKENGKWILHSTDSVIINTQKIGAGLLKLGLSGHDMQPENQDKIAIISRNRPEWLMLDLATQQIGILICPIYPTTNANEIEFIFNEAQIKYAFVSDADILEKVNSIKSNVPSLIDVYSFDDLPGTKYWKDIWIEPDLETTNQLEEIKSSIKPTDCVTIIYTSGTTGVPKGVMLSHQSLVMNVLNSTKSFPFPIAPNERALSFLPLNHIFERMASYIYISTGISIYYAENLDTIGDDLKEVKPLLFATVPRLLEKVFDKIMAKGAELKGKKRKLFYWAVDLAEKFDNINKGSLSYRVQLAIANLLIFKKWRLALGGNVKYIITGGAACQVKLLRIFTAAKIPVFEGYGPTENCPVISVNCNKKGGTKFGTVGLVIDGQEVKIESDGEICVKGPSIMMGYYKHPEWTAEVIKDGWLHTGDIGIFEEGKYLKITDRKKEMFKTSGGKYVAPQVIENKLKESPFVEQLMVLGDNEKFVSALIVPSFSNLKTWMISQSITFTSIHEAIQHPEVVNFYNSIIENYNGFFNHVEQVKKIKLLSEEWSVFTGELTPKLSLKRKVIMGKYQQEIEWIYK
jgi:long-chain acyl-CoA synthetase